MKYVEKNKMEFYDEIKIIIKIIDELVDDACDLASELANDYDADFNDWCKMCRIAERLEHLKTQVIVVWDFQYLIDVIDNEKARFEVQKCNKDRKEYFINLNDIVLDAIRKWNFNDYRCRRFQDRLEDLTLKIKSLLN